MSAHRIRPEIEAKIPLLQERVARGEPLYQPGDDTATGAGVVPWQVPTGRVRFVRQTKGSRGEWSGDEENGGRNP